MKIGVFGDSFADKSATGSTWWKYLEINHDHVVRCFGESGSSLVFSAQKILENYKNYDFVIWCVTSSNRITAWHRANYQEISVHVTGRHHRSHPNPEIQNKINVIEHYLLEAWDAPENEFMNRCVIEYVKTKIPNMLLIPCFPTPVYEDASKSKFDLFNLCIKETNFYFPGIELADLYDRYTDMRQGHFTDVTHKTLADLIARSLTPGVFVADYDLFPVPQIPLDQIFRKNN